MAEVIEMLPFGLVVPYDAVILLGSVLSNLIFIVVYVILNRGM